MLGARPAVKAGVASSNVSKQHHLFCCCQGIGEDGLLTVLLAVIACVAPSLQVSQMGKSEDD